jgi:hypothetical protein
MKKGFVNEKKIGHYLLAQVKNSYKLSSLESGNIRKEWRKQ